MTLDEWEKYEEAKRKAQREKHHPPIKLLDFSKLEKGAWKPFKKNMLKKMKEALELKHTEGD